MRSRGSARPAFVVGALLLGSAAAFGLGEVGARLLGSRVRAPVSRSPPKEVHRDPVLGWKLQPGRHLVDYRRVDGTVTVTILEDGSRKTFDSPPRGPEVWLVGCSFTFGWGLSDEDTLGWKLQEADPSRRYVNLGVAAYSTYQSLLALEQRLRTHAPPALVLYGFIRDHEVRNVAYGPWIDGIMRDGVGAIPYCDVDSQGRLVRFPPISRTPIPLRRYSALITAADNALSKLVTRGRLRRRLEVQRLLIEEMNAVARRAGARFAVALLDRQGEEIPTIPHLESAGIPYADLRRPHPPELRVSPADYHPNGKLTALWAEELLPAVNRLLNGQAAREAHL